MKFLYEYRTPDNVKHSGTICAADKEAAYAALKRQGIKPCRFAEAPGVFNKLFGKGKRWIAIGVLGVGCLLLGVIALQPKDGEQSVSHELMMDSTMRRQILGDSAVIEKGIATGWEDVFELPGERFLASFAIPGAAPAVATISEEELRKALDNSAQRTPHSVLTLEARQIRAMVEGMKDELRDYFADGGTFEKYMKRIVRRQNEEIGYYTRAKAEIEKAVAMKHSDAEVETLWETRNAQLRCMGIRLVPLPQKKRDGQK